MIESNLYMEERYGKEGKKQFLNVKNGSFSYTSDSRALSSITDLFKTVFLPQGYPDSVSKDYYDYQVWDTIQAYASSITGTLATQSVLKGAGVGDSNATALAATLTFILKDGSSKVSRILFAWWRGMFLDTDAKRWRFFADILNDMAICIQILSGYYRGSMYTLVMCLSSICFAIVGVAGNATRAALTQHQARRNNMADVSAKDGSQETLVQLTALLTSFLFLPFISGNQTIIWTVFIAFTCIHLLANYKGTTSVVMESFNLTRLDLMLRDYLSKIDFESTSHLKTVEQINRLEPIVFPVQRNFKMCFGTSLSQILNDSDSLKNWSQIRKWFEGEHYCLWIVENKSIFTNQHSEIHLAFQEGSKTEDHLKAAIHATILNYMFDSAADFRFLPTSEKVYRSQKLLEKLYTDIIKSALSMGWRLDYCLLPIDEWRFNYL